MNLDETERRDGSADPRREANAERRPARSAWSPTCRRRRLLRAIGGVATVGLLAGCSGDGGDGITNPDNGGGASSVDEWLAETDNYDGSVADLTGETSVTVEVGARGNMGSNAFAPAAIEVSPGTTVTWKWIDGYHNVVATDGQFESGNPEQNATFEHTFETAGTYLYYCEPHRSMGMKGAVVVAGSDAASAGNASTRSEAG